MTTLGTLPSKNEKNKTTHIKGDRKDRVPKSSPTEQSRAINDENALSTDDKNKSSIECFNCGKAGHIASKYRKPHIECERCNRLGHRAEKYPLKKDINTVKEINTVSNLYERPIIINGHKITGLIDTGNGCTLVRISVAAKYNMIVASTSKNVLRGFAGQITTSNRSTHCEIKIMGATARVDAIVVPDNHLMCNVIVGRDFLEQEHIITIKKGNKLIFKQLTPVNDDFAENIEDVNYLSSQKNDKNTIHADAIGKEAKQQSSLLQEFRDCISYSTSELGKTDAASLSIRCTSDVPIAYRPYRLAENEKSIVRNIIQELLDNNIIRESNSPYASPILLVKKKNGEYRMCVDYRKLNAITVRDKYPMPLIEEQIDKLEANEYFTGLDLASGYYQVPVTTDSIEKTAFVTPEDHYEFLRMSFGLTNAPAVFQRLMDKVLGPLKNSIAFPYLDDVIIPSQTIEEGITRLRQVLSTFRTHNLTLKLEKRTFFARSLEYLGREVSAQGVRPGQSKIEALVRMERPRSVKQIQQVLGLASYFRRFVENFATIVEPLTRLTRKNVPWVWEDAQEQTFNNIKEKLTTRPVLMIFDPERRTEVHTDASAVGVGAILLQEKDGRMAVVAYFSRQTTKDQRCYHSYELETMAVVLALRHFRVYLLGTKFKVVTDCNALRLTFTKRDLLPRIGRWWLEIQEYTFDIEYRAGSKMAHVDALSRNPMQLPIEVSQIDITEGDWVLAAQLQDEQLSRIRAILLEGNKTRETKHYFEYILKKDKIY